MKVLFAIDDVVLDTTPALVDEYNRVYRDSFRWEDVTTIPFYDSLPKLSSSQEAEYFLKSFANTGGYERIPFVRFAKKSLAYLQSQYRVGFISARPSSEQEAVMRVFSKHKVSSDSVFTHSASLLAASIQPEYWFDESSARLDVVQQQSPRTQTYLFSRPWNACSETNYPRVSTWVDVLRRIS
ncbi:MAG: hypothetical protein ACMXYD_05345 [Candidatus Woesearchaeota archaeon]